MRACETRLQEIELRVKMLREESAEIESRMKCEAEEWKEWKKAKRAHERELASLVSYLVDRPVITADGEKE